MTNFTKPQLKDLHNEMQKALEKMQDETWSGVTFNVDSCTYRGGEATFKVKVLLDGAETKEEKDLTQMSKLMGLDTSKIKDYGTHKMTLTGYNSKATKMPWIVQDLKTSRHYKLTDTEAKQWFKKVEEIV
jgi:hypothetical protein